MSKHTKGPWQSFNAGYETRVCDAAGETVALVNPTPDQAANADLIAAAPDLLAACRMALDVGYDGHRADRTWIADLLDTLRAAISKAEGNCPACSGNPATHTCTRGAK